MLLQGWAMALLVTFFGTLFVGAYSGWCALRVLRYWDHGADTSLQIELEGETWLASALMQYALGFQLLSLFLLVLAADSFSGQLAGAMCATGALSANSYGMWSLATKIVMVFLSSFWLLLHRLDMEVETYPLVRLKYGLLLLLVPILLVDGTVLTLYLVNLEPDVITSCCGVLFRPAGKDGYNLIDPYSAPLLLSGLYSLSLLLLTMNGWLAKTIRNAADGSRTSLAIMLSSLLWLVFFAVALWTVTAVFSSYIYAMPSHRCPFDMLRAEYGYVGYPLYLSLFGATLCGAGCGVAEAVRSYEGLLLPVRRLQRLALPAAMLLLLLFLAISGYAPLRYLLAGGET